MSNRLQVLRGTVPFSLKWGTGITLNGKTVEQLMQEDGAALRRLSETGNRPEAHSVELGNVVKPFGNAFVMVTLQGNPRFSTNFALVLLTCAGLCLLLGCGPGKDKHGKRPEETVQAFVKAIESGEFSTAARFWKEGSVSNIEASYGKSFREFCEQQIKCEHYSLSKVTKQKAPFVSVTLSGYAAGAPKTFMFYLERVDGEWRLSYDR